MNPLNEKANTLSRCGSFYYRTLVDDSKADAEFVSHTHSYTRLMALGDKITTAIKGGCYYEDYYKIIKFTDRDIDWNGVKEALQRRIRGGMGAITSELEYVSSSKARELGASAWVLLKEDVPTGLIDVASVQMQTLSTAPIETPVFLQVYIIDPEDTAIRLATSTQSVTLAAGEFAEWSFAEALIGTDIYKQNSHIAFQFTTNANATWQDDDYVPTHLAVGAGAYVPAVQFYKLAAAPALPSFSRPAQLTIEDHFFMGDNNWNWLSKEGTPQPIAFPGGEKDIILPESQELIWDLHVDEHIMVTSIRMDDGTMLYANQDFASQFGKLTFLKNPIALFPKMQFMAQSYTGRMPNLYNYLVRADEVYGSIGKMMNYMRGAQSIKSFYHASAQAAGLAVIEKDCTVVAVSPLLEGKLYITTAGRYEANYPHTPLKPGTKLPKDYIIGGNQLYRLIGPYDPMPSNITGINLGAALPVPGLIAPNKSIILTDKSGTYTPMYEGDASAVKAYHDYIKEIGMPMTVPGASEYSGIVTGTALLAACQLIPIKDSFAGIQYKEGDNASIIKIPYYKAYGRSIVGGPITTSFVISTGSKLIELNQQNSTVKFTMYGGSLLSRPPSLTTTSGVVAFEAIDCDYTTNNYSTLKPDYETLWHEVANKLLASNVFAASINTPILGINDPTPNTREIKTRTYGTEPPVFDVPARDTTVDYTSDADIKNSCIVLVNNEGNVTLHVFAYHFKHNEYLYCSGHLVVSITGLEISDLFTECEVTDSNGDTILYGQSQALENGISHFRYTACPNRCVVACINESYMTSQMKLRLMTYLQRELPIGSVLTTANLPNIVNEFQSSIDGTEFVLEELRAGLNQLVGVGNYEMEFDTADNKLIVHTDRLDDTQLAIVTDLIEGIVPSGTAVEQYNHNIEISWRDINKYAECVTIADMVAVNPDYKNDVTSDGEWVYPLPELVEGRLLFEEAINLKKINITLPKVTSLYRTFIYSGLEELTLTAPKANGPNQWINSLTSGGLRKMSVALPTCTGTHTLCGFVKAEEVYLDIPEVLGLSYAFTFSKVKRIKSPHKILKIVSQDQSINETNKDLEEFPWELPYLRRGDRMLNVCSLNKDSALRILNSIPVWTDGSPIHLLGIGIHIDLQTDTDVLAAIANAEARGWTFTLRWNGTPTSGIATLDLEEIYAKVTEHEMGDYTDENGTRCYLDWGHYVTDATGYKLFFSIYEAEQYFKLTKVEEQE